MSTELAPVSVPRLLDVRAQFLEIGSIRVGTKDERGYPLKLSHFLVCDRRKVRTGTVTRPVLRLDLMERIAETQANGKPIERVQEGLLKGVPIIRELDVVLLLDHPDLSLYSYRGAFASSRILCRGYGVGSKAERWDDKAGHYASMDCPGNECEWSKNKVRVACNGNEVSTQCKSHCVFKVCLPEDPVLGGYYIFRSTSTRTIGALLAGLRSTYALTGGRLAGVPLRMRVIMGESKIQGANGKQQTVSYPLVTLGYSGNVKALFAEVAVMAQARMALGSNLAEFEAQLLSEMQRPILEADPEDVAEDSEFHVEDEDAPPPSGPASQDVELLPAAPPGSVAERARLLDLIQEAVRKTGSIKAVKSHLEYVGLTWQKPTEAPVEVLEVYVKALREAGMIPAEREPGAEG